MNMYEINGNEYELKNCPLCGGEVEVIKNNFMKKNCFAIGCKCGIIFTNVCCYFNVEDVDAMVDRWNKRE